MEIKEFLVACGEPVGLSDVKRKRWERPGMALVPIGIPYADGMFAVRSWGTSMEPMIRNRMWCLFHPDVVGTRQDRIVLVEDQSSIGLDRYTLKKYFSRKTDLPDGTWAHEEILLLPLNRSHATIPLRPDGSYRIRGWFVVAVSRIHRIQPPRYRNVAED
jgi:peptidase S24-like protein